MVRIAVVVLALAACATPYEPKGAGLGYQSRFGYSDQQLSRDTFFVDVRVNESTSAATAYEYFVRRATELCRRAGFETWRVEDRTGGADTTVVPVTQDGTTTLYASSTPYHAGVVRCFGGGHR